MLKIIYIKYFFIFFLWVSFFTVSVKAQDIRQDHLLLETKKQIMQEKADNELKQAKIDAKKYNFKIKNDKKALELAIADLLNKNKKLVTENKTIEKSIMELQKIEIELKTDLSKYHAVNQELSGFIKTNAKDLQNILIESLQSGLTKSRYDFLNSMLAQEGFWSMDDIAKMTDSFFNEIKVSGEVKTTKALIINRFGIEQEATVLTLGNFTGIYKLQKKDNLEEEIGFLLYSNKSQRFFALSKLPSNSMTIKISDYLQGEIAEVPIDISKGTALRQLTHQLSLMKQIPKGGPLVFPILLILIIALIILVERVLFFTLKQIRTEPFMNKVRNLIVQEKWEECEQFFLSQKGRFIPDILLTALPFRNQSRQDMENALQEAILGKIPQIERFLSTLGMVAAIAPLLGLLGTVTGMINTFHVITYYGTGDPKMMSGGISEALITTMLGLTVAIPIMLFHTFLSRKVETQIGLMEEKAVAFVNTVFKNNLKTPE